MASSDDKVSPVVLEKKDAASSAAGNGGEGTGLVDQVVQNPVVAATAPASDAIGEETNQEEEAAKAKADELLREAKGKRPVDPWKEKMMLTIQGFGSGLGGGSGSKPPPEDILEGVDLTGVDSHYLQTFLDGALGMSVVSPPRAWFQDNLNVEDYHVDSMGVGEGSGMFEGVNRIQQESELLGLDEPDTAVGVQQVEKGVTAGVDLDTSGYGGCSGHEFAALAGSENQNQGGDEDSEFSNWLVSYIGMGVDAQLDSPKRVRGSPPENPAIKKRRGRPPGSKNRKGKGSRNENGNRKGTTSEVVSSQTLHKDYKLTFNEGENISHRITSFYEDIGEKKIAVVKSAKGWVGKAVLMIEGKPVTLNRKLEILEMTGFKGLCRILSVVLFDPETNTKFNGEVIGELRAAEAGEVLICSLDD